ncbi:cytosine permease [Breznakiellaceae bacterium SP9]
MNNATDGGINRQIEKEAVFGILPVLRKGKLYNFFDAFLVLSGYCIATWSYTQGAYLAGLVDFKQLLTGAFFGAILMLIVYQLPVILSVRYGIDIWIWLRAVFGRRGVVIMTVVIITINFPWYAVCAELFASSMSNLAGVFGIGLPEYSHRLLALLCVWLGVAIAYKGIGAITWTTRILVPLLLAVGVIVVIVGFSSVPIEVIWNYRPANTGYADRITPYLISIEANFAFVITLVGGMAAIPRLAKTERGGFWAGVLGQGLSGSFFVVVGAVMAISMGYVTGVMSEDPTLMLAALSIPALAFCSLLLVAFANIGTQAVGSYIYGVMLKSSFKKADYRVLIMAPALYVSLLCLWGGITTYFASFLTISACIYAPLAALLFVDFFILRRQKISLRSAFALDGFSAYNYSGGINLVGFFCIAAGVAMPLLVYDPINGVVHNALLFRLTPTGFSFIGSGLLYYVSGRIPLTRRYLLRDRSEITV